MRRRGSCGGENRLEECRKRPARRWQPSSQKWAGSTGRCEGKGSFVSGSLVAKSIHERLRKPLQCAHYCSDALRLRSEAKWREPSTLLVKSVLEISE